MKRIQASTWVVIVIGISLIILGCIVDRAKCTNPVLASVVGSVAVVFGSCIGQFVKNIVNDVLHINPESLYLKLWWPFLFQTIGAGVLVQYTMSHFIKF